MKSSVQPQSWFQKIQTYIQQSYQHFQSRRKEREEEEIAMKKKKLAIMSDELKTIEEEQEREDSLTHYVALSYTSSFKFWLIGIVLVYLGYLVFQSLSVIYLVFAALIISMAMEAGIHKLSQRITRGPAILLSYILLILFVFSGFIILVPFIIEQLSLLVSLVATNLTHTISMIETGGLNAFLETLYLPDMVREQLVSYLDYEGLSAQVSHAIQQNLSNIVSVSKNLGEWAGTLFIDIIGGFFNSLMKIGIVVILAMFFSIEKDQVVVFLAGLGGSKHRIYRELKLQTLYKKLGQWLQSQVIVALFIGTFVYIMLWIISPRVNLDGKFSLALISALTTVIPYLGPLLGGFPALVAASISSGPFGALVIILTYGFVQQVEGNFFTPFFMKRQLGISPVLILLVVLLGGITLGLIGVILAVPLAVIITLLLNDDFT